MHYVNWNGTHSAKNLFDGAAHHVYFDNDQQKYVVKSQAHTIETYSYDANNANKTLDEGEFFLRDNTAKHNALDVPYKNKLKNIYPLLFSDTEYAYEALKQQCKKYKGYFVSLSGGFDSAYTMTVLASALEIKFKELMKLKGGVKNAFVQMCLDLNITPERHSEFYQQFKSY